MNLANPFPVSVLLGHRLALAICLLGVGITTGQETETKAPTPPQAIIVAQGAGGTPEYTKTFSEACEKIKLAAEKSKSDFQWIGNPEQDESKYKNAKEHLEAAIKNQPAGDSQLWLILIGHGTFDRQSAKFNLRGPDVTAKELDEWLGESKRPVVIVNCASSSAPFINQLASRGRVVVTATKSGFELNYTRFGSFFADALTDHAADIDKDEQVSVLEAFLFASKRVDEFYKTESRLATEHALIDDNGDGKGTPLTFFRGVRVIKRTSDDTTPDGAIANRIHLIKSEFEKLLTAEMRKQRQELEDRLEDLRLRKSKMDETEYFAELEKVSLELALIYQQIEKKNEQPPTGKKTPSTGAGDKAK